MPKLFFGGEVGSFQTVKHIEAFQEKIEQEMSYLISAEKTLDKIKDNEDAHKYYLLTVRFGIQTYRAYLEWCKEAKEILIKESER